MIFIDRDIYANETGIYQIRNIENDYVYIGQTSERFLRRFWHHKWLLKNDKHSNENLQRDFRKYGEDSFVFEVLECIEEIDKLDAEEIRYITNAEKKYNLLGGGGGRLGYAMKDSTKKLIGDANRKHLLGQIQSEETRKKRSASLKGNPKMRQKKYMAATEEQVVEAKRMFMEGYTIKEVAEKTGLTYHSANGILSNNAWSNYEVEGWDEFIKNKPINRHLTKDDAEVIRRQYDDGTDIDIIAQEYGVCRCTIQNILRRKTFK